MSDGSYPPSLLMLPASHDLAVKATVKRGTSDVSVSFDALGKPVTVDYGDGASEYVGESPSHHTYSDAGRYTITVSSGKATATADVTIKAAAVETESNDDDFGTPIPVDEVPESNDDDGA